MKRKLRVMESYPPLVELQQQITELIRKIERIGAKEALALAQKLEEQKREDALKVQLESARAAAAAHPHSSSTTAVSTPPSLSGQQDQAGSPQVRREPHPLVSVLGRL